MSKFGLEYKEETGYDVGVYCQDADNKQSIWYFHEHYVEWLEHKIEALSQVAVIKSVCSDKLDCPFDFTSRCTIGRCGCKPKQTVL